jgi:hypothetical protein
MDPVDTILERLAPELAALEEERQHALARQHRARTASFGVAAVAAVVAIAVGRETVPFALFFAAVASLILGVILHAVIAGPARREFTLRFKSGLVRELVRGLSPGMEYLPSQGISEDTFRGTQLFATRPDRYHTEDLLTGRIGDCPVSLAEVHAEERRTRTDSDGKTETYYVTIFRGILMVAEFPKSFHGVTRILPDNEQSLFSGIGKAVQGFFPFGSRDLVRLEDPEFENHFQVYATDQVEARYLLSTSFMRRLLDLRELWNRCALRVSFVNAKIHVALPCQENFFEPDLRESLEHNAQFHRIAAEIRSCLELVEHLNLQVAIWRREGGG